MIIAKSNSLPTALVDNTRHRQKENDDLLIDQAFQLRKSVNKIKNKRRRKMRDLNLIPNFILLVCVLFLSALSQTKVPTSSIQTTLQKPVTSGSKPDLQVIIAKTSPTTIEQGKTITINYTIKNNTSVIFSVAGVSVTKFYLSADTRYDSGDLYLTQKSEAKLNGGDSQPTSVTHTIPQNAPTGNKYVIVVCDANIQVPESNETNNNKATGIIKIIPLQWIDLQVTSASVSPLSTLPEGQITISYTIKNAGNAQAGASVTKFYLSDDANYGSGDVDLTYQNELQLTAGGINSTSVSTTIPAGTGLGNKYVLVLCDANGQVQEKVENNNVKETGLIISANTGQKPDLSLKDVNITFYGWGIDQNGLIYDPRNVEVVFDYKIVNLADVPANVSVTAFRWKFMDQERLIGTHNEGILGPNEERQFTSEKIDYSDMLGQGENTFSIVVDDEGRIDESDESNNVISKIVSVVWAKK